MQNLDVGDLVYRPTKVISTLENNFACTEFNFIYSQPILQPLSLKAYLNGRLDREEEEWGESPALCNSRRWDHKV